MTTTAIILSHYKEREKNLIKIIGDLQNGSVKPDKIVVICDNPDIIIPSFPYVNVIRFDSSVLPIVRFAIGAIQQTTHCLFIDDDLTVGKDTLKQFLKYADIDAILGFEGNINGVGYTDGKSVDHALAPIPVDVIIRLYFAPVKRLSYALELRNLYPDLPKASLDDVFLCLGNKYLGEGENLVIPADEKALPKELETGNVGQCMNPDHYTNRNIVCSFIKRIYEENC